jgi:hypothetical protein
MSRSNPWKKKPRYTQHTTLIVVEGDTEYYFIQHLRQICGRNCGTRATIENVHGGSGDHVLKQAIKKSKDFDTCACLYDMDRAPTVKRDLAKADCMGIVQIASSPCIEAFLLELLGQSVPRTSEDCKRAISSITGGQPLTDLKVLGAHFGVDLIRRQAKSMKTMEWLWNIISPRQLP